MDKKICSKCKEIKLYDSAVDSYFCLHCNIWLENSCSDPDCDFCVSRREKPLTESQQEVVYTFKQHLMTEFSSTNIPLDELQEFYENLVYGA